MPTAAFFDAFAILAGALMAGLVSLQHRRYFGAAMAIGVLASVGGGTLRDLLLGLAPVFWIRQPWQIYLAETSTAAAYLLLRPFRIKPTYLPFPDALSVAIPAAIGARRTLEAQHGVGLACMVGLIAGMTGGILRDLLCEREPAILKPELYGVAAAMGAGTVGMAWTCGMSPVLQLGLGSAVGAAVRLAALRYHIRLGKYFLRET